jgi:hypothetical protein
MKTINSLSGGKTSSYMAIHYPADYNLFAVVQIEDINCKPKDESIVKYASEKLGKDFIATAESDKTLYAMRDLEQLLGKNIIWVGGDSFDTVIKKHGNFIPNMGKRFCTTDMKIRPMAEYIYKNIMQDDEPVFSNVGIRYDEKERAKTTKEDRELRHKIIVGNRGTRNKWLEVFWGVANYPLVYNRVTHYTVYKFWQGQSIKFPEDSNCVGCFWKPVQQLRKNFDDENAKMEWFNTAEINSGHNWKSNITYEQIKKIGLQQDFFFGTGSGCQAGFCTD